MKDPKKVSDGKKSRAAGQRFEQKVRKDLESKGWIVDKWSNNVEINKEGCKEKVGFVPVTDVKCGTFVEMWGQKVYCKKCYGKIVPSKPKYVFNPRTKSMQMVGNSGGFPDFIAMRTVKLSKKGSLNHYLNNTDCTVVEESSYPIDLIRMVIGVESKMNGKLDATERIKCEWLIENNIFSQILIASKGEKRGQIVYEVFV